MRLFHVLLMVLLIPGLDPVFATAAIVFACAPMLSMYPLLGQRYGFGELGTARFESDATAATDFDDSIDDDA